MKKKRPPTPPESWPAPARQLYQDYYLQRSRRFRTARASMLALNRFLLFQEAQGYSLRDFPPHLIDDYLDTCIPSRRSAVRGLLRPWLRFLYQRKQLLQPLHQELETARPKDGKRRVPLTPEQVLMVLNLPETDEAQGLRDRAYLELAYGSALRRSELAHLELSDLDLAEGLVFLRDTKNGRERKVPLTRWSVHFLRRYLSEARPQLSSPLSSNTLWLSRSGRKLHPCRVRERLRKVYRASEVLGIPFTPHQLRHSAATHLLQGGASVRDVQEFLGHVEPKNTAIYTQITPIYLQEIHERHHPRNLPGWPVT